MSRSNRGIADFKAAIERYKVTVVHRSEAIFDRTSELMHESIVEGSPVTAAPGQPVDTGNLKLSWYRRYLSRMRTLSATNVVYAPSIEDGVSHSSVKPIQLRSTVGGFHSVKLTRANFKRLVNQAVAEVVGGA